MTKKFPQITSVFLIKVLLKLNYVERRQTGSHKIFKHAKTKKMVIIPFHNKDLKKGLVQSILKQLELSKEAFIKLL